MKLAEWLTANNVKRKDFADLIGVSPASITAYCNDQVEPSLRRLRRIEEVTGRQVSARDFGRREAAGAAA